MVSNSAELDARSAERPFGPLPPAITTAKREVKSILCEAVGVILVGAYALLAIIGTLHLLLILAIPVKIIYRDGRFVKLMTLSP